MAEREGFEPSKQVTPLNGLANRRTRPLCDLSVRGGQRLPQGLADPGSKEDEAVPAWILAAAKRGETLPSSHGEVFVELGMQLQDAPIVRRVGDQEDEAIGSEIALLQARFALDGLDVGDACLGFDDDGAEGAHDPTVAAPEITGDRHGHLGLPPEVRIQAAPKPFEQRQMGSVANGIPVRVERDCDLQPDHRRDPRGEVEREGARLSALCALDTVRPDPGGLGNLTDAETGIEARGHELLSYALT